MSERRVKLLRLTPDSILGLLTGRLFRATGHQPPTDAQMLPTEITAFDLSGILRHERLI